jgi:hypothetical protein
MLGNIQQNDNEEYHLSFLSKLKTIKTQVSLNLNKREETMMTRQDMLAQLKAMWNNTKVVKIYSLSTHAMLKSLNVPTVDEFLL